MNPEFTDQKLFSLDKNYILKEAQKSLRKTLLNKLVELAIEAYFRHFNPLHLEDDTTIVLDTREDYEIENIRSFYFELAGIYRYKYGENQLEFLFDGLSHFEKYKSEWQDKFLLWSKEFCKNKPFIRTILEATVLTHPNLREDLINQRLKSLLSQYFDLKIYKYRGIQPANNVA